MFSFEAEQGERTEGSDLRRSNIVLNHVWLVGDRGTDRAFMLKLLLFSGAAGLFLGSAIPPGGSLVYFRVPAEGFDATPSARSESPRLAIDWAALDTGPNPPCSIQPIVGCIPDWRVAGTAGVPQGPIASAPAGASAAAEGPDDAGSVRVVVSIPQQKAYVFRNQSLAWTSKVSTGKRGHETPLGTFTISQKKVRHRSNLYSNAPMPYMQRLTSGGVALHAGHVPGYRASHGCIRLPWSYAKKLYAMTRSGTKVHITNERPRTAEEALRLT